MAGKTNASVQVETRASCGRCGLPLGNEPGHCGDYDDGSHVVPLQQRVECRDRELSNLRALLRMQVRRVERVMEELDIVLEAIT